MSTTLIGTALAAVSAVVLAVATPAILFRAKPDAEERIQKTGDAARIWGLMLWFPPLLAAVAVKVLLGWQWAANGMMAGMFIFTCALAIRPRLFRGIFHPRSRRDPTS